MCWRVFGNYQSSQGRRHADGVATVGGQLAAEQHQLMLAGNRIEAIWPVMKSNYNLIYHRARNVTGMSRHLLKLNCIDISNFGVHLINHFIDVSFTQDFWTRPLIPFRWSV